MNRVFTNRHPLVGTKGRRSVLRTLVGTRSFQATLTVAVLLLGLTFSYIDTYARASEVVPVVAHRGYSSVFPENSLSAFRGAAEVEADMMELDVQRTSDGVLVVFHDDDMMRMTGREGRIADYTYQDLCYCDIGRRVSYDYKGERIPTLDEALEVISASSSDLVLELKEIPNDEDFEQQVYDAVVRYGMLERVIFGSFKYDYLRSLKEMDEGVKVMLFSKSVNSSLVKKCPADYYGVNRKTLNKNVIRFIHQKGGKVYAYTVKTQKQMSKLKDMGVDGIISDDALLGRTVEL